MVVVAGTMALFTRLHVPFILVALSIFGWQVVTNAQTASLSFDEIIAADANLTAWKLALQTANISLADVFADEVTVFAPINSAFTAYNTLLTTYADEQYIAHLQNLLLLHVVNGEIFSTDLMDGQTVTAANGEAINVMIVDDTVRLFTADSNATVGAVDVASSDGVLHQIDGVLLPAFINSGLRDLTQSVDGYSILIELLQFTGLSVLLGPDLTATIFAPTDAAFEALPAGALEYYRSNKGITTKLLSGHVISPQIIPTQNMKNGDLPYLTPAGTSLTIEILKVEGVAFYIVNNATIVNENILANNGIIHGLASILEVPGTEYTPQTATPTTVSPPTATPPNVVPATFVPVPAAVVPVPATVAPVPVISTPTPSLPVVAPISEPSPSPAWQTQKPTAAALPPTTKRLTANIDSVKISFTGVEMISTDDVLHLQRKLELWFETFFNEEQEIDQRLLQHQKTGHRKLQQYRVQNVRNVVTSFSVLTQDTTTFGGSNSISFTQSLIFDAVSEPENPEEYILLPFMDSMYKNLLFEQLKTSIVSFAEMSAISSPIIAEATTMVRSGLSAGAIIGVAIAVAIGLLLVAVVIKIAYMRKVPRLSNDVGKNSESRPETLGEQRRPVLNDLVDTPSSIVQGSIVPTTNSASLLVVDPMVQSADPVDLTFGNRISNAADPQAQTSNYKVTCKDQSRLVVGSTQPAQLVAQPRIDGSTGSILPIAMAASQKNVKYPSPTEE